VLAPASGRENHLVHIRKTFRSQMKENTAVAIYNRIMFPVLEIRHQLDLFTSMHHFHSRRFTPINHFNFLLRSKKQEEI
jgi:hypothetical protein